MNSRPEQRATSRLLPHECVFGFFLALTWLRLVLKAGPLSAPAVAFFFFLIGSLVVIRWAGRQPTSFRWRCRLLLYPVLMGISFYTLPAAMGVLAVPSADPVLANWDYALVGNVDLSTQFGSFPWLTDLMMVGYLFFFLYLVLGPAVFFFRDLDRFRQCFVGLFTVYGVGFIGYTFFPAGGPHAFLHFAQPLTGGWITEISKPWVDGGSNGVDVFPSIHVAVSLYLLMFDAHCYRRRFVWLALPCAVLWVSTVYLRYHYSVDVLAGAFTAICGYVVARGFEAGSVPALSLPQPLWFPGIKSWYQSSLSKFVRELKSAKIRAENKSIQRDDELPLATGRGMGLDISGRSVDRES
ncbi:MAG: phosphatase PAP2 family protein [Verrucomicrobiota bacterium]